MAKMPKTRNSVPKAVRDAVLREFNHLCAICRQPNPQLHHIDEDPSNNDPQNLVPLCANHHITDQHNPTSKIDIGKLRLFRRYKDPCILRSQFHPLYQRSRFLSEIRDDLAFDETDERVNELVAFTVALKMGEYYSKCLAELLRPNYPTVWSTADSPSETQRKLEQRRVAFVSRLRANAGIAEALIVEMLRYQDWQGLPF